MSNDAHEHGSLRGSLRAPGDGAGLRAFPSADGSVAETTERRKPKGATTPALRDTEGRGTDGHAEESLEVAGRLAGGRTPPTSNRKRGRVAQRSAKRREGKQHGWSALQTDAVASCGARQVERLEAGNRDRPGHSRADAGSRATVRPRGACEHQPGDWEGYGSEPRTSRSCATFGESGDRDAGWRERGSSPRQGGRRASDRAGSCVDGESFEGWWRP